MATQKSFKRDEIIFRQGDPSPCMYSVLKGKVGIYLDYGGGNETKLAELLQGQFLGEMGMLNSAPRSSSAVALEDDTLLEIIPQDDFAAYFEESPDRILILLLQLCVRLRQTTGNYVGVCGAVHDALEAEIYGAQKSEDLQRRIAKYTADFKISRPVNIGRNGEGVE